jgi:hypothetical protein
MTGRAVQCQQVHEALHDLLLHLHVGQEEKTALLEQLAGARARLADAEAAAAAARGESCAGQEQLAQLQAQLEAAR